MTRDKAREILERSGSVSYHAWTWTGLYKGCWDEYNCCADSFTNVEEVLDDIEWICGGKWENVVAE